MRVATIMPQAVSRANNINRQNSMPNVKKNFVSNSDTVSFAPPPMFATLTFTGGNKNMFQVGSLAYENMGTGLPEDYQGGMGVVTYEGPKSMIEKEKLDVRSFSPIHQHNNAKGGYKFLYTKNIELVDGKLPDLLEAKWFISAAPGQSKEELAKSLNYDVKDLRYVIQSEPNGKEANSLSKYCLIEPTGVKGSFERMSDNDIGKLQKVEYELFEIAKENPTYNELKGKPNYWIYTQELAKTTKPYSYGSGGHGGFDAEIINSDFVRAYLGSEKQMNTKEFGFWNPASYWGHDRPVASIFSFIADASAKGDEHFNGLIPHHTFHNPGKNYQGFTDNPFLFARFLFDKDDVVALSKHPQYELLQNFNAKGWGNLTKTERKFVTDVFDPMIGQFKDFFGNYNISKIPIIAKKVNPKNSSLGTVSPNFDKEMKNPNMDVAPGIGGDLREVETISPLNGSSPSSLGLDNNTKDFGRGGNLLSERKSGFTPLVYDGDIEKYIANKEKNAKWMTDILAEAGEKGQKTLNSVFYNDLQIEQGRSVIGNILNFTPGKDLLVIGWGRPDEQKAYSITLNGVLKFFKREDVPTELKSRFNLQIGWGDLPYDKNSREWKLIDKAYNEIINLEGGIFKNNVMLADGRYPNKLVACATHCLLTSRREMCGITPLEGKAGATPSAVTATGGPVDYINEKNGWKTKTAPEMNPPFDGLSWDTPADIIDDARVARSSDEVSECIKSMVEEYANDKPSYIARCKKNIEEKFDWHNNGEFNGGKSANKMYREDVWKIDEGFDARNKKPLKRLIGNIQNAKDNASEAISGLLVKAEEKITELTKQAEEKINKLTKEAQQNIQKATEDAAAKTKESIEKITKTSLETIQETAKTSVENAKQEVEKMAKTSLEEMKETISSTVKTSLENANQKAVQTVKTSKFGKAAAFTSGAAAIALSFGGWYFYKGNKLLKEAKSAMNIISNPVKETANHSVSSVLPNIQAESSAETSVNTNLIDRLKDAKSA